MKLLTEGFPGTGGNYKETPEDFQVEEIPLYACSGSGEHLYLWIEKQGISTRELLHQLAKGLQLKEFELGYAGLKDTRALTRQMISVPARCSEQLSKLQLHKASILAQERHGNKLRLGHLAGNRFLIRLHNVVNDAASRAEKILQVLQERGVPNRFGEQRYGVLGNSAQLGLLLLQQQHRGFCRELLGDPEQIRNADWREAAIAYRSEQLAESLKKLPQKMRDERRLIRTLMEGKSHQAAVRSLSRSLLRLFLSASQSLLFDRLLTQRLPHLDRLEDGDIAVKHVNGACFRVANAASEQARADNFEISPSAPLFGHKVMLATEHPGDVEKNLLEQVGLTLSSWQMSSGLAMPGERRALRAPLREAKIIEVTENDLTLSFALGKGSYATCVLAELIK